MTGEHSGLGARKGSPSSHGRPCNHPLAALTLLLALATAGPAFAARHLWLVPGTRGRGYNGVAWDASTRPPSIVATDPVRHLVVRISLEGKETVLAGQPGQTGFNGDQPIATQAWLNAPACPVPGPSGTIDFVDGTRVRRLTAHGALKTLYADGGNLAIIPETLALGRQGDRFVGCQDSIMRLAPLEPPAVDAFSLHPMAGAGAVLPYAHGAYGLAGTGRGDLFFSSANTGVVCQLMPHPAHGTPAHYTVSVLEVQPVETLPNPLDPFQAQPTTLALGAEGHLFVRAGIRVFELTPPPPGGAAWRCTRLAGGGPLPLVQALWEGRAAAEIMDFRSGTAMAAVPGGGLLFTLDDGATPLAYHGLCFLGPPDDDPFAAHVREARQAFQAGDLPRFRAIVAALRQALHPPNLFRLLDQRAVGAPREAALAQRRLERTVAAVHPWRTRMALAAILDQVGTLDPLDPAPIPTSLGDGGQGPSKRPRHLPPGPEPPR